MLTSSNFETQEINLLTDEIPENAQLFVLATPATDYTQDEIEKLGKRLAELEAEYSENPAYMAWVHQQYTEKAWKVKKNEGNR